MEKQCTLCSECPLFKGSINIPEEIRVMYKLHYCAGTMNRWKECKRYCYQNLTGECPDFVMPNSLLSFEQIRQKSFDEYQVAV
jgi:hypothetical protein